MGTGLRGAVASIMASLKQRCDQWGRVIRGIIIFHCLQPLMQAVQIPLVKTVQGQNGARYFWCGIAGCRPTLCMWGDVSDMPGDGWDSGITLLSPVISIFNTVRRNAGSCEASELTGKLYQA